MSTFFFILFAVLTAWWAISSSRKKWDVDDTPTVTPSGAMVGLCEIQGAAAMWNYAQGGQNLVSPVRGIPCVWYCIHVEKYVDDDDDGSWQTMKKRALKPGFRIADQYGSVAVHPEQAELFVTKSADCSESQDDIARAFAHFNPNEASPTAPKPVDPSEWQTSPDGIYKFHPEVGRWILAEYVSPDSTWYYEPTSNKWLPVHQKGAMSSLMSHLSFGKGEWNTRLRVTETIITPGQEVFVHGNFSVDETKAELAADSNAKGAGTMFISTRGPKKITNSLRIQRTIGSGLFLVFSLLIAMALIKDDSSISASYFVIAVGSKLIISLAVVFVVFVVGATFLKFFRTYNRFVRIRERIDATRSTIDITLKRRYDLIPQLCDVIEGATAHEAGVQEQVAQARAQTNPDAATKSLLALAESYPNLKTTENFAFLQNELGRTEEKIAMARSFLNDSVLAMDNLRATIFGIIFSPFFKREQYWQA